MAHPRPSPAKIARGLAVVGLFALLASGCGKGGPARKGGGPADSGGAADSGPALSTPADALEAVVRALAAGDLAELRRCATAACIEGVERDLRAFGSLLTDPVTGPRALARLAPPRDAAEKAVWKAGLAGDAAGLLYMLSRSLAADAGPTGRAEVFVPAAGVDRVDTDRVLSDGTRRRVVLVRLDGAWKADRLAL